MDTVAIVGVGLIGGSFGLALKKAGFAGRILGVSSPATIEQALLVGAIDEAARLDDAAAAADLIYLAQPIRAILGIFPRLARVLRPDTLVTDAGSTKVSIVQAAAAALLPGQFLGGHPMAGKERRGVEHADPDLFRGRVYALTPEPGAALDAPQFLEFQTWLGRIGARALILPAEEHDRVVAFTSHLPQLISTALARLLAEQGPGPGEVFGPALLDSTRLALSPFEIWADILATNACKIDRALSLYIQVLQEFRSQLCSEEMERSFDNAAGFARKLRKRREPETAV